MAEIRWTLIATEDLRLLEDWIARDSALRAIEFTDRLASCAEKIGASPSIGRIVPEFDRASLREAIFGSYRIVYSVIENRVTILRVVHGARDLRDLADREPWSFE